jgi:hypothetical protein
MNVRYAITALLIVSSIGLVREAQAAACDKGSFLICGQLGYSYYTDSDLPDLAITPRVLYFPANGFAVGCEGYLNARWYHSEGNHAVTHYAIGPRVAYYLSPYMTYVGASALYVDDNWPQIASNTGFTGRIGIGAAPMIGEHGTAFIELGYETQVNTDAAQMGLPNRV